MTPVERTHPGAGQGLRLATVLATAAVVGACAAPSSRTPIRDAGLLDLQGSCSQSEPDGFRENARLSGWVYVDLHGRDLSSAVRDMQAAVAKEVALPAGYSLSWSGQFEFLERATQRMKVVVPATLLIIFVLLYLTFARFSEAALIMVTLPFALVGSGSWRWGRAGSVVCERGASSG